MFLYHVFASSTLTHDCLFLSVVILFLLPLCLRDSTSGSRAHSVWLHFLGERARCFGECDAGVLLGLGPMAPACSNSGILCACRLCCKMQISRRTILQGPQDARCSRRSGSRRMLKCTQTNLFPNICICLFPVCIAFIHKAMCMKTGGPFKLPSSSQSGFSALWAWGGAWECCG